MKKKVELTKIDLTSLFRAVVITMAIPLLISLVLAFLGGAGASVWSIIMAPVVYGLVMMLLGASYNWLAPHVGGVIVEIDVRD